MPARDDVPNGDDTRVDADRSRLLAFGYGDFCSFVSLLPRNNMEPTVE